MPKKIKAEVNIEDRAAAFNSLKAKYKTIMDPSPIVPVDPEDCLQTPSISMNHVCGKDNGIRKGSIVCVYGPYGSYKTTLSLMMIKQAQDKWPEKSTAYIDTEWCTDLDQARDNYGVNFTPFEDGTPRVVNMRPETAEETWDLIGAMATTGQFSIIVLDSITALRAKAVVDAPEFTLGQMGLDARITSGALKKYETLFPKTGTILWLISQERNIQLQPYVLKGPSGGYSMPFYMTHMFKIEQVTRKREEDNKPEPQQSIKVFCQKMKWAKPFKEVEIPVVLGRGIDSESDIINCAISAGLVKKDTSWVTIGNEKVQGVAKAAKYLAENPEIKSELVSALNQLNEN